MARTEAASLVSEVARLRAQVAILRGRDEDRGRAEWARAGAEVAVRDARRLAAQVADVTRLALRARQGCEVDPWSERIRRPVSQRYGDTGSRRGVSPDAWVAVAPGEPGKPWRAVMWVGEGDRRTVLARGVVLGGRLEGGVVADGTAEDLGGLRGWVRGLYAD